jgi:hypothetical protein
MLNKRFVRRLTLYSALLVISGGAFALATRIHEPPAPAAHAELLDPSHPYPPGRWRLAPPDELDRVVLWVSHILVRHQAAPRPEPAFAAIGWNVQPPPPARDRNEAIALARRIQEQARRSPDEFARLAQTYSDDLQTRAHAGSLGGVTAAYWLRTPQVLDALASLAPGQISEVVETDYGFHILLRRAPPVQQNLAARRIVIGYATAPWLRFQARSPTRAQRTREQALALSHALRTRLTERPQDFPAVVAAYSETRDAADGGDVGVWSNREPSPLHRELEALAALGIGEISEPLDTPIGFQIWQRVAAVERPAYAMSAIKLNFELEVPSTHAQSREALEPLAASLLRLVQAQPSAFSDLQRQYCCEEPERWTAGRGDPALTALIERTAPGAIADHILAVGHQWIIAKRTTLPAQRESLFELPEPIAPDIDYLVRNANPKLLARTTRSIGAEVGGAMQLEPAQTQAVAKLYEELATAFETATPDERVQHFADIQPLLRRSLGDQGFERCMTLINAKVASLLLTP